MNAADRKAFPQASRIVRISDGEWGSEEDELLRQLCDVLMCRARERQLERLLEPPPRVLHGSQHVYLLYGPGTIWVDDSDQLQADVRGLVFEPIARISREGNVFLNIGADDCS